MLVCPATTRAQGFIGVVIGERAEQVLWKTGKTINLESIPLSGSKRILNDTIPIGACSAPFRRSLGFDKQSVLSAIGLTHKTNSRLVDSVATCAFEWVSHTYGPPSAVLTKDSVQVYEWMLAEGAVITLEAKAYNERDHFVLIYYYRKEQ